MNPHVLETEHNRIMNAVMVLFHITKKMGGAEFSQSFADRLSEELLELYVNFQKHNESKNVLAAARTPAMLFIVMVVCYLLAGLFTLVYLPTVAALCNLVMGAALIALTLWAYVRYSGIYRSIGIYIDSFAEFLWSHVSIFTDSVVWCCVIMYMIIKLMNRCFTDNRSLQCESDACRSTQGRQKSSESRIVVLWQEGQVKSVFVCTLSNVLCVLSCRLYTLRNDNLASVQSYNILCAMLCSVRPASLAVLVCIAKLLVQPSE